jgi:hypothetical protein
VSSFLIAVTAILAMFFMGEARASEVSAEITRTYLYAGTLSEGVGALKARAIADPLDGEAVFGLGMVQFTEAVEHLAQGLYRYGLHPPKIVLVPILRFPLPPNPTPETLTFEGFRALIQTFTNELAVAENTLSGVGEHDVHLVVDLAKVRLDMKAPGSALQGDTLAFLIARLNGQPGTDSKPFETLEVNFDAGDAAWLRGYCHALMALDEFLLAHDFHSTFDVAFHLFFPRTASPLREELRRDAPNENVAANFVGQDASLFADIVALVHTINWPVVEPIRMAAARTHLKSVIAASRQSWKLILAETDDDREWLPNPRQKNSALGWNISQPQLDAWFATLEESEGVLDGRLLVPHWRFTKGIDLKDFFEKPHSFDLVLLLTGAGALPFLRDGEVTTSQRWREITSAFGESFVGYAFWIN